MSPTFSTVLLAEHFLVCTLAKEFFLLLYSSDAISRAYRLVDSIPGRATGAYSHSQVVLVPNVASLCCPCCRINCSKSQE